MQKSSFLTIVTLTLAAATMPMMCMVVEKPTFIFTLPSPCVLLKKSTDKQIPEAFRKNNEITCTILHINHQENDDWLNIKYLDVHYQIGHNDTKKHLKNHSLVINDFTDNATDILMSSQCFEQYKTLKGNVLFLFPSQFPRKFIEKLKEEGSITHQLEKCTVIFQLDDIPTTQHANKDIREGVNAITEIIKVIRDPQERSTSNSGLSYFVCGGIAATVSIFGFLAWLMYSRR